MSCARRFHLGGHRARTYQPIAPDGVDAPAIELRRVTVSLAVRRAVWSLGVRFRPRRYQARARRSSALASWTRRPCRTPCLARRAGCRRPRGTRPSAWRAVNRVTSSDLSCSCEVSRQTASKTLKRLDKGASLSGRGRTRQIRSGTTSCLTAVRSCRAEDVSSALSQGPCISASVWHELIVATP